MQNAYGKPFLFCKLGIPTVKNRIITFVRYADDIALLAKSERAAKRLLEQARTIFKGCLS